MHYELGNNSRVLPGKVPFLGNITNGSFIALTDVGLSFIEELQKGKEVSTPQLKSTAWIAKVQGCH